MHNLGEQPHGIRLLELRSALGTGGGPEKTILLGAAGSRNSDIATTVCYIRDKRDANHDLARRAAEFDIAYVEVREKHSLDWSILAQLARLVRTGGFDIIHAHDYKTDLLALILARLTGAIPLATAHGWTGHSWRERYVYYPADKRLLARFPLVIAVSGEVRDELIRTGSRPDAVRVVLNGIDSKRFVRSEVDEPTVRGELALPIDAFVIGAVGRLEPQKRFDILIEAAAQVRARHPAARLVIAGSGSQEAKLMAQAERLGLGEVLIGHCADVRRLHHAFDLFVQSSDYEGTSNSVLEAMAMRTPVIATNVGGTAEILHDETEGIIVPKGSASALADAISTLLRNPDRREQLRRAARKRVEGPLSFRSRMEAVEKIYFELMVTPSRRGT